MKAAVGRVISRTILSSPKYRASRNRNPPKAVIERCTP
jgi:hypothetical protein